MIPKVIHYCWFGGGEKPKLVRKCIASWKKYCPDYEIIEWNESNCNLSSGPLFVKQATEAKKWGFVPDYYRAKIVYENGGIYLDTDVELIKSLDQFLHDRAFWSFHGALINSGQGFGAEKGTSLLQEIMDIYDSIPFFFPDGSCDLRPCTVRETPVFIEHGLIQDDSKQVLDGDIHIYPEEYFDPGSWGSFFVYTTENTVSIHHYASSWYSEKDKRAYLIKKIKGGLVDFPRYLLYKALGRKKYNQIKQLIKHRKRHR